MKRHPESSVHSRRLRIVGALSILIVAVAGMVAVAFYIHDHPAQESGLYPPSDPAALAAMRGLLRVGANPHNLPFSNERKEGYENRVAELIASDLGREVEYTWWPERRGPISGALRAGNCDVIMSLPTGSQMARTTRPYYRSGYVFITRKADDLHLHSLADQQLQYLQIGLNANRNDVWNVLPARSLAARGIVGNVHTYPICRPDSKPRSRELIDAVARGEIDIAISWGPLGGDFAQHTAVPLDVNAIRDSNAGTLPMTVAISMAVRQKDVQLASQLNAALQRRGAEVESVLKGYGVPFMRSTDPMRAMATPTWIASAYPPPCARACSAAASGCA